MPTATSKVRIGRLVRSLVFCAIAIAVLAYAGAVVKPGRKGNVMGGAWLSFEKQPHDSIDVLVLGTSHAFTAVDPSTLWKTHGIPSFVLAGPVQKLTTTRYYLQEALRTQHPKVVALEMVSSSYLVDRSDPAFEAINVGYMPWSTNKIDAALLTRPLIDTADVLVDLTRYHARWDTVSRSDLDVVNKDAGYEYLRGFVPMFRHKSVTTTVSASVSQPLTGKLLANAQDNLVALRTIADLCRANGAELVLMLSPTGPPGEYTGYLRSCAGVLSREYSNVSVLDLSLPDKVPGLSYTEDFYDGGHMTYRGAEKSSAVLAASLATTFHLPDRRGDARYRGWTQDVARRDAYVRTMAAATK